MKKLRVVLWTLNVGVLLFLLVVTGYSFHRSLSGLIQVRDHVEKGKHGYEYSEKCFSFQICYGSIGVEYEPTFPGNGYVVENKPERIKFSGQVGKPSYPYYNYPEVHYGYSLIDSEEGNVLAKEMFNDTHYGFQYGYRNHIINNARTRLSTHVTMPYWIFLVIWAGVTVLVGRKKFVVWRRNRRWNRGHCPNCNYDLQKGSKICPECGRHPHT